MSLGLRKYVSTRKGRRKTTVRRTESQTIGQPDFSHTGNLTLAEGTKQANSSKSVYRIIGPHTSYIASLSIMRDQTYLSNQPPHIRAQCGNSQTQEFIEHHN